MHDSPPPLARTAVVSSRWLHRATAGLRAVHAGFWLGVLNEQGLDAATARFYATEPHYIDRSNNAAGLFTWEEAVLQKHCPTPGRILVPGAGGGREMLGLLNGGYDVAGYDPSSDLVSVARELLATESTSTQIVESTGVGVPQEITGPFDCVLFGWGAYSHIQHRTMRVTVLRELHHLIAPDGVIVVSFLPREPDVRRFHAAASVANALRRLRRRPLVELGDWVDGSFDHYFSFDEIASELEESGFEVIERSSVSFPVVVGRKG